jgi:hypothetical protein
MCSSWLFEYSRTTQKWIIWWSLQKRWIEKSPPLSPQGRTKIHGMRVDCVFTTGVGICRDALSIMGVNSSEDGMDGTFRIVYRSYSQTQKPDAIPETYTIARVAQCRTAPSYPSCYPTRAVRHFLGWWSFFFLRLAWLPWGEVGSCGCQRRQGQ